MQVKPMPKRAPLIVPVKLEKENDLNKAIRNHKREESKFYVLYYSLWDEYAEKLIGHIEARALVRSEVNQIPVYLVNTFDMPHSTMIYGITKVPCLVTVDGNVNIEDYLPHIYRNLRF